MTTVRFNVPQEFMDELRQDHRDHFPLPGVERHIVRVTTEMRTTAHFPARNLLVVATYKVHGHPTIVRLERFIGQVLGYRDHDGAWGWFEADKRLIAEANRDADALRGFAESLGLDVRGGVIEDRQLEGGFRHGKR